jgi:hypothetical protein
MRKHRRVLGTCMVAAVGLSLHANSASGQQPSMKEGLVGTWIVVSWEQKKNDGTTLRQFGENPTGMAIFDAGGRYINHGHALRPRQIQKQCAVAGYRGRKRSNS